MPLDSKHPKYAEHMNDWALMDHVYRGERAIKEQGETYLPPTAGQRTDGLAVGNPGYDSYNAYRQRAVFPDFVRQAADAMVGIMTREPATIELPDKLKPLMDRATAKGEDLQSLLRKLFLNQLREGRLGLLLEVPDGRPVNETLPFFVTYKAPDIINWNDGTAEDGTRRTNLVVLDETESEMGADYSWETVDKYRVLRLNENNTYESGIARMTNDLSDEDMVEPAIAGTTLSEIPFVFVNAVDHVTEPEQSPLLGLANLCLAIYRLEADYRQALHFQGQDTLVVTGGELPENTRIGAGGKIEISKAEAKVAFIGVSADGLGAQREALEDDRSRAGDLTTKLFDGEGGAESGRALNVRLSAKTATLHQIAATGAAAVEKLLRVAAEWVGANPDEVKVEPNMDFNEDEVQGQALLQLMQAVQMGLPLSKESIHRWLRARDITELDFEDEMDKIENEMGDFGTGEATGGDVPSNDPPPEEVETEPGNDE